MSSEPVAEVKAEAKAKTKADAKPEVVKVMTCPKCSGLRRGPNGSRCSMCGAKGIVEGTGPSSGIVTK